MPSVIFTCTSQMRGKIQAYPGARIPTSGDLLCQPARSLLWPWRRCRNGLVEETLADRRATETGNTIVAAELTLKFIVICQLLVCIKVSLSDLSPM